MKNKIVKRSLIIGGAAFQVIAVIFLLVTSLFTLWSNTTLDHDLVRSFDNTIIMTGKDSNMGKAYGENDIIFFNEFDKTKNEVKKGDIICFYKYRNGLPVLSSSRIHEETIVDNQVRYIIKDDGGELSGYYLSIDDIVGVYTNHRIVALGCLVEIFASSTTAFFLSIILPMAIFFILDVFLIVKYYLESRSDDDDEKEVKEDEKINSELNSQRLIDNSTNNSKK